MGFLDFLKGSPSSPDRAKPSRGVMSTIRGIGTAVGLLAAAACNTGATPPDVQTQSPAPAPTLTATAAASAAPDAKLGAPAAESKESKKSKNLELKTNGAFSNYTNTFAKSPGTQFVDALNGARAGVHMSEEEIAKISAKWEQDTKNSRDRGGVYHASAETNKAMVAFLEKAGCNEGLKKSGWVGAMKRMHVAAQNAIARAGNSKTWDQIVNEDPGRWKNYDDLKKALPELTAEPDQDPGVMGFAVNLDTPAMKKLVGDFTNLDNETGTLQEQPILFAIQLALDDLQANPANSADGVQEAFYKRADLVGKALRGEKIPDGSLSAKTVAAITAHGINPKDGSGSMINKMRAAEKGKCGSTPLGAALAQVMPVSRFPSGFDDSMARESGKKKVGRGFRGRNVAGMRIVPSKQPVENDPYDDVKEDKPGVDDPYADVPALSVKEIGDKKVLVDEDGNPVHEIVIDSRAILPAAVKRVLDTAGVKVTMKPHSAAPTVVANGNGSTVHTGRAAALASYADRGASSDLGLMGEAQKVRPPRVETSVNPLDASGKPRGLRERDRDSGKVFLEIGGVRVRVQIPVRTPQHRSLNGEGTSMLNADGYYPNLNGAAPQPGFTGLGLPDSGYTNNLLFRPAAAPTMVSPLVGAQKSRYADLLGEHLGAAVNDALAVNSGAAAVNGDALAVDSSGKLIVDSGSAAPIANEGLTLLGTPVKQVRERLAAWAARSGQTGNGDASRASTVTSLGDSAHKAVAMNKLATPPAERYVPGGTFVPNLNAVAEAHARNIPVYVNGRQVLSDGSTLLEDEDLIKVPELPKRPAAPIPAVVEKPATPPAERYVPGGIYVENSKAADEAHRLPGFQVLDADGSMVLGPNDYEIIPNPSETVGATPGR